MSTTSSTSTARAITTLSAKKRFKLRGLRCSTDSRTTTATRYESITRGGLNSRLPLVSTSQRSGIALNFTGGTMKTNRQYKVVLSGFGWLIGISLMALAACTQIVEPAFAAPAKAYVANFKDNTVSVIDTE